MKDLSEDQRELKEIAQRALLHYHTVLTAFKKRTVFLLQRYSFLKFGKGLGLKLPKPVKPVPEKLPEDDLCYSEHFRALVVCVIRQKGAGSAKVTIKQLSQFLEIPRTTISQWWVSATAENKIC